MGRKREFGESVSVDVDEACPPPPAPRCDGDDTVPSDLSAGPVQSGPGVYIVAVEKVLGKRVAWLDSTGTISLTRAKMSPTDVCMIIAAVCRLLARLPGGNGTLQSIAAAVEYEAKRAPLDV